MLYCTNSRCATNVETCIFIDLERKVTFIINIKEVHMASGESYNTVSKA